MVDTLMTREQAAAWACCSTQKIDALRRCGALPYTKVGRMVRISPADLRQLFQPRHVLKSGRSISDADCWDLAAEAERGYDVGQLVPAPRGGHQAA